METLSSDYKIFDITQAPQVIKQTAFETLKKGKRLFAAKRIGIFASQADFQVVEDGLNKLQPPILNQERIILVSSHHSHLDGVSDTVVTDEILALSNELHPPSIQEKILSWRLLRSLLDIPVLKQITEPVFPIIYKPYEGVLRKFHLPVSVTMEGGQQGENTRDYAKLVKPFMQVHNIEYIPIVTENDIKTRNIKGNNIDSMKKLACGVDKGYGILFFPSGNTEEGKRREGANSRDEINGLQDKAVKNLAVFIRSLHTLDKRAHRSKETWFAPLGTHGAYRSFDPETKRETEEAVQAVLGLRPIPKIQLRLGAPISLSHLKCMTSNLPSDQQDEAMARIIMGKVSELLPDDAKGIFRKSYH